MLAGGGSAKGRVMIPAVISEGSPGTCFITSASIAISIVMNLSVFQTCLQNRMHASDMSLHRLETTRGRVGQGSVCQWLQWSLAGPASTQPRSPTGGSGWGVAVDPPLAG